MLRRNAKWFPVFLRTCPRYLRYLEEHAPYSDLIDIIYEQILHCSNYRQVTSVLEKYSWQARMVFWGFRSRAVLYVTEPKYITKKDLFCFKHKYTPPNSALLLENCPFVKSRRKSQC